MIRWTQSFASFKYNLSLAFDAIVAGADLLKILSLPWLIARRRARRSQLRPDALFQCRNQECCG